MPSCEKCGDFYNPKRRELGYRTCLPCGSKEAAQESIRRKKCVAPAYNKGAYQYVGSKEAAKWVGK